MGQVLTLELEQHAAAVRELLAEAVRRHGRVVYANSLGAEAMVLTDIICTHVPGIDIISIDTGRLHEETHELLERLQRRYHNRIRVIFPDAGELTSLIDRQGTNGFFHSSEARSACCHVRKVLPFKHLVAGYSAWVTGVRREQSRVRALGAAVEWDAGHGLFKVSPLLDWTADHVWAYIHARGLPYNALHDRQYPSIGCAPCTRAVQPGESSRAGRWWWESAESRECGLHPRTPAAAAHG
ncbi:MAG TPA: phosphoadenylyl-sulfate reductase [Steroidobacteraceae bacterium]|nr:phosphoadenylyl-sulfate reductase [Steroidobacteraceae bacterium]